MIGLSVVPGLPNMTSTPWAVSVSINTCLPRMTIPSAQRRFRDSSATTSWVCTPSPVMPISTTLPGWR